jgi:uncharacterized membrane protein YgcG
MRFLRTFLSATLLLFLVATPAAAQEVINKFISDVTVAPNGALTVRESITVNAEGSQIRRGILRDFPTTYSRPDGTRVRVGFEVLKVERDGRDEPYALESMSNGQRIRIGDTDVFLSYGEHTYDIYYTTNRQIGFFDGYDELYWNVTGNGWTFPILNATAIIRLPAGAEIKQHSVYTGPYGERGSDAEVIQTSGGRFSARTTRALGEGEGFTVAVAWQKGIVAPPTAGELRQSWIMDNLGFFGLIATLLLVPSYYFYAWFKVGRDPPQGNIIPLFKPPEGLGPAGVRYIREQGFDDKAFAAALVGLAVKRRASVIEEDGGYTIKKEGSGNELLTRSEASLLAGMPATLRLKKGNHASVGAARSSLESALDDEYDGTMFLKNFRWFAVGFAISLVGLIMSGFLMPEGEGAVVLFTTLFSSIWWGVILAVGYATVKGVIGASSIWTRIRSLMGLVFLIPFIGAGIAVPLLTWFAEGITSAMAWFIAGCIALAGFNFMFFWLLRAPTPSGRRVLDQIDGFRMYLTTAEEERLKVLNPPEKTAELFERYLPYAMALVCDNEWSDKFTAVLAAAAAAGASTTVGNWYHGSSSFGSRDFTDSIGSSLASSISSAATAPGSSSGSGGGGFSGGGGGGGGGSGW